MINKRDNTKTGTRSLLQKEGIGDNVKIAHLLKLMVNENASDLHLSIGSPPGIRIFGEVVKVNLPALLMSDTKRLVYEVLTDEQRKVFEEKMELDFSFEIKKLARFRANVFHSRGGVAAVFRTIPTIIPDFKQLGLPNILLDMIDVTNGIILVTGPTGSGKSTTLAALIDHLNNREAGHIVTLEDPIEFSHQHKTSIINQREIGSDAHSFGSAMRSLLRQDPDIVLVGELRDTETVEYALKIAETGHLVFATLHTNSTVQTINRLISVFPSDRQEQVRTVLSFVLQGVIAQQLIPKSFESGRVCALEIMRMNPAIRNLIREDKIHQIYSQMQIGQDKTGMVTLNQNLIKLVNQKVINAETALSYSNNVEELKKNLTTMD